MKKLNLNNNSVYVYLFKTLESANSFRMAPYRREAPILLFADEIGYYLGVQYYHNHIGFVSED